MSHKYVLLILIALTVATFGLGNASARMRRSGTITVNTSLDTSDTNFDYVVIEVTNNTGEVMKDFHTDPAMNDPSGTPQEPPTGSGVSGSWSAGKGDNAHNWGSNDGGVADGTTAVFKIQISKNYSRSNTGTAIATNDGNLNKDTPANSQTATTSCTGIPTKL